MSSAGPWHTEDFDSLSWHDVHVHGFRFDTFKDDNGSADLVLDIDYILKWEKAGAGFQFTVCQADLRFHDVVDLKFNLDYATPTAGMCPFSIDGVERDPGVYGLWKDGEIIYIGASAAEAGNSIRARLLEHLKVCDGVTFPRPDHYSWEVANEPQQRKAELLVQYQRLHGGRLPQLNAGGN